MNDEFINYRLHRAESRWAQRTFLQRWWRIYGHDRHWAPPPFRELRSDLSPRRNPHLARMEILPVYTEAFRRRQRGAADKDTGSGYSMPLAVFEETVSAAVLIFDPRREDRVAYLAMLRTINHQDVLEQLLYSLSELLWQRGYRRVIGPTGLSPYLGSGTLLTHFHVTPPLHSAYNPPYFGELLAGVMEPVGSSHLYSIQVGPQLPQTAPSGLRLVTRPVRELAGPLLPLFQSACEQPLFPAPDATEAGFICRTLSRYPTILRVVQRNDEMLGFVLLGADQARLLRFARGDRNPLLRAIHVLAQRRPVERGRLLFGGVAPAARGAGLGRLLWQDALATAHAAGWKTLAVGPAEADSAAARFLVHNGARMEQEYALYATDL